MKKKFLAMALGIAVVLSCTACGGGSSDAAAPASGETNAASSEAGSDSAAGGNTTVTVAIVPDSPHWIQDMFTRNIHRLLLMHVMRIFSSSTAMTVQQNLVWQILMNSQMTIRL